MLRKEKEKAKESKKGKKSKIIAQSQPKRVIFKQSQAEEEDKEAEHEDEEDIDEGEEDPGRGRSGTVGLSPLSFFSIP